ncbi:MAG: choice-of-anchor O protein [Gammaproteobacteria bacterium]
MKIPILSLIATGLVTAAICMPVAADDGEILRRQISSPPGEVQNPEPEGEHAFIQLMNFRVPAQAADGTLLETIDYITYDGETELQTTDAKPLISAYVYGPVIGYDDFSQSGFPGHGKRDAYAAVSLDDGATWKRTNLSGTAELDAFELADPVPDAADPDCHDDPEGEECTQLDFYPGDVTNIFHSVAGNRVIVAWQSRFCSSGSPGYTGGTTDADTIAGYLGIDNSIDMYLTDLFVVGGSQLSVDYKEQEEFAGEYDGVGEVPFNCLWSARGILRENPDEPGTSELVWFQAERLTSGRRDVNRIETSCVAGAGCAVSWQEDPEGLRPGEGEGAGTGWAGATTNSQTDIWYSFIEWEDFDIVDDDGSFAPLADQSLGDQGLGTGRPKAAVPMMVPARLTNNARCQTDATDTYCASELALAYGLKDQCVGTVDIPLGPQGNLQPVCVVDSNESGAADAGDMPNVANTAASRPRLNLQPRDTDGDDVADDAWVIIVHEEDKGLGRFGFLNDEEWDGDPDSTATPCDDPRADPDDNCQREIGKNQWYITFALGTPQTSQSEEEVGMVANLVAQHNQLNAPEVNWRTGTFYPPMSTEDMWDFGEELNYAIFNTEIARRASLMSQSVTKASSGGSGLVAMPLFKEGTINQGGPADIMARRIVANQCPIPEEDPEGPIIEKVDWVQYLADGKNIKIKGRVAELDDIKKTGYFIRDAVNTDYVFFERNDAPKEWENFLAENLDYPPCYIQVSDEDPDAEGQSVGNWGEAFDLTDYWEEIGVECECILPASPMADNQPSPAKGESTSLLAMLGLSDGAGDSFSLLNLLGISDAHAAIPAMSDNPYDFSNMECAWYDGEGNVTEGTWLYDDGSNPYYPKGLCTAPSINLSARTPYTCEQTGSSDGVCPGAADMECVDDSEFGQLCSSETDPEDNQQLDKLLTWYECPGWNGVDVSNGGLTGSVGSAPAECYIEPDSALLQANLDDRSWYNPIEISKAHRGFLDGDHVFMIYAWSPNWKLNAVGRDRYELYTRRSFDGGISWTTTPGSFTASDGESYSGSGTTTCETWRDGADSQTDSHVCTQYGAGDPEQSRNVSQHKSMLITTLDPRYTPTSAEMPTDGDIEWALYVPLDPTDLRRPDRNFVVFESGDNTTVAVGEAEPLNLDYGRAIMFGDHFVVWAEEDALEECYPNNNHTETTNPLDPAPWAEGTGFCNEFDPLEGFPESLSEEASVTSSAAGDFLYGTWGQFNVDDAGEFVDGDVMFRRVWYLDDYIPTNAWTKGNQ